MNYRTNNSLLETFAVNSLNELSSVNRSGTLTVAGTSTSPASSVNVSGTGISGSQAAAVYADSTWALQGVTLANGQNTFTATATDSYNRASQASTTVNLPASRTFTYDANGNLLGDGTRSYTRAALAGESLGDAMSDLTPKAPHFNTSQSYESGCK